MTDHPVLIPAAEGPVGGVVSEPGGERRAALILLAGWGRPARSGVNAFWARTARALADAGVVVLRIDYSREGETLPIGEGGSGMVWKRDLDLSLLRQVTPWFRERVGGLPLLLAGSCSGARLAIELAGSDPDEVAGMLLVVPYLDVLVDPRRRHDKGDDGDRTVDPHVVDCVRTALSGAYVWILVGERDAADVPELKRRLGPTARGLELEVVPGSAVHMLDRPALQREVATRLMARATRSLAL